MMDEFEEWLRQKRDDAREKYKNSAPRSENPRLSDVRLGKSRAYRNAYREYLERTYDERDSLDRVEDALYAILSELDADTMDTDDRIAVETACQEIHVAFGGQSPEAIYRGLVPDDVGGGDR